MMRKLLYSFLFFFFLHSAVFGQTSIWSNQITGNNISSSAAYNTGELKNANITVTGIRKGAGVTTEVANGVYTGSRWTGTDLTSNDYFEFILTPNSGYSISLSSFQYVGVIGAGSSPVSSFSVRSSIDGYSAELATTSSGNITLGAAFQNRTSAITFRIYAWGAGNNNRTYGIDSFAFNGWVDCLSVTKSNAGPDQTGNGSSFTLAANSPSVGTGVWSIASGPNTSTSQFSSTTSRTAIFSPTVSGTYFLNWTISNGGCTSTDQVVISNNCVSNLIRNGDFSAGSANWTFASALGDRVEINQEGTYFTTTGSNDNTAELDSEASLKQTVTVVPNVPYTLSFIYAKRPGAPENVAVNVRVLGSSYFASTSYLTNISTTAQIGSFNFTPTNSSIDIEFYNPENPSATFGSIIDNIVLLPSSQVVPIATTVPKGTFKTLEACAGIPIQLDVDNVSASGVTYSWTSTSPGAVFSSTTIKDPTITFTGSGLQNATVAVTTQGGCSGTPSTTYVNVKAAPTVYNVTGGGSYCPGGSGLAINLSGSAALGSGVSYQLQLNGTDSGAAVAATGSAINFGPKTAAGTYTVIAKNSNNCALSMNGSAVITVNPNPTATAGSALSAICQGATSAAMGGSVGGGATGGTWSGGSGTWTNAGNPATAIYTAGASESGSITLTLTTSGGSCGTATSTKTITVNPNPTANAGGVLSAICQGATSAAMGGSIGGGATGGTWTGGSGTWANATNPSTATYTAGASESGSVTLRLTTSGGSCGTTFVTKTITVNPNPTANAGSSLSAICQGGTSEAMGGSVGGGATGGIWTGGAGTWTNATNPSTATYTAGASESGSITLRLTTSGGSCGTTFVTKAITVNPNPTADAGPSLSAICQGGTSAAMGGSVGGGATGGTWTGGAGTWANASNPATATYTAGASESGSIILTLTTSGGSCGTTSVTKTITVNPINRIALTSAAGTNAQSICFNSAITDITYATTGGNVVMSSGFPTGLNIAWSGSVLRISGTPNVSSASPYNYTVALQGACETVTLSGTITVKPLPTAPTIAKNNDAACNTLGSITITGLSGNGTVNQTGATTLPKSYPGTGASLAIQDLAADTYSFTVTNNATGCTSSPATVTITDTSSNTEWDATGWTNGEPDGSKSVTISYVTASHQPFTIAKPNIAACSLTITAASNVIVPNGVTLTITNKVTTNGNLVFESGSSLLQTTNVQNQGTIVYKRTTKINRFDLTYWSSPVTGELDTFKMKDLSSETLFDKFFTYSPTGGWATNMYGMAEMERGKGYSIRGPQSFDTQTPADFTGEFKGRPNNGDITVPSVVPDKWFLLGNPYPSAIDVDALWDANKDVLGALYFWTHVAPPTKAPGDNTYRYTSNDYVVYTASGGTVVSGTKSFDGFIAAGQGFFARPKTTEIHFNNDMRRGSSVNGSFFKVASKSKSIERNRIWLNMVNSEGAFKQILVGYIEGATNNVDFNYDAPTISGNSYLDFYSLNETKKLTIQGRALPFENTDLVPLGYKTTVAGDFTIGLDHGDGFFNKQEVYLEDKTTGKTINLRNENYTFSTLVGTFTDRFVLRYTSKTLGTDDLENIENSVLISVKNKTISITCSKETIKEVTIFNVGAQLVYSKNKVNSSELQIANLHSSDQVLLVKVTLENGSTITKKVIFSNL